MPLTSEILLFLLPALASLTLHEAAHAVTADRLGDPTPRLLGRVTLNPLAHLDALGTLLLVVFHFGWGKPVPVDVQRLPRPRRDLLLIALAGPLANLACGVIFGLALRLGGGAGPPTPLYALCHAAVIVNLLLAVFNLLPLPPLDGSRVLACLLPTSWGRRYNQLSGPLTWGLFAAVVAGAFFGNHLLGTLLFVPIRWLYPILTGTPLTP